MKLLIFPPVERERLARIREAAGEMAVVNAKGLEEAKGEITDADAFFGKLTPELLRAAGRLRWVQSSTASLEHYLFPGLIEHPCTLTNMKGIFYDVVADHALAFVLCFARNLHEYLRRQREARWEPVGGERARPDFTAGSAVVSEIDRAHLHLADCILGVVGLGSIGGEVARRAKCFGMRVLAVDPVKRKPPEEVEALWTVERLNELLESSDFVVVAAPHTPETVGMFGLAQFRRMKKSAFLINVGRGVIVRLDDLCRALDEGLIAGAGLDVFEEEPLPSDHPLWRKKNVILTPHVASSSVRVPERHLATLLENVRRFAQGRPLLNVVDKRLWF